MQIITVINAKGGCGKSTIAMSLASGLALRGFKTLLIDMDPQAQVTQWLGLGDGLSPEGTLVSAMEGKQSLDSVVQGTQFENLSFIASSQQLEDLEHFSNHHSGVSAVSDEAECVGSGDRCNRRFDGIEQRIDGSSGELSQHRFDLGDRHFDRVVIR